MNVIILIKVICKDITFCQWFFKSACSGKLYRGIRGVWRCSREDSYAGVSFLKMLQALGLQFATLLKGKLWYGCFLVDFLRHLKVCFLRSTSRRLLLKFFMYLSILGRKVFFVLPVHIDRLLQISLPKASIHWNFSSFVRRSSVKLLSILLLFLQIICLAALFQEMIFFLLIHADR